jgi:hypothetical protein
MFVAASPSASSPSWNAACGPGSNRGMRTCSRTHHAPLTPQRPALSYCCIAAVLARCIR